MRADADLIAQFELASTGGLFSCIAEELQAVEVRLQAGLDSRSYTMSEATQSVLASKGKRFRPAILLLAAKLCGYETGGRHIELATVAEYMHVATLIHDDIIDHAEERRGRPAAHVQWGTQASVLVGDFLYGRAIQRLVADGNLQILQTFSDATVRMSEGEVLELEQAGNLDLTEDEYLEILTFKTAALIAAACRAGALIAAAPAEQVEAMSSFGLQVGIGFQLVDDALDFIGYGERLGKPIGQDVRERKVTGPVLHVMRQGSPQVQQQLRACFAQEPVDEADCRAVLAMVAAHDGVAATLEQARQRLARAKACLEPFPDSPVKDALLSVTDFVRQRDW